MLIRWLPILVSDVQDVVTDGPGDGSGEPPEVPDDDADDYCDSEDEGDDDEDDELTRRSATDVNAPVDVSNVANYNVVDILNNNHN